MANPTIEQLQNKELYELIAELNHKQIKEFVVGQLSKGGWLVKSFMIYQVLMLILAAFILSRSIVFAFQNNPKPLYFILAAVVFCFSALIILHELLHGVAIKFTGAKKVNYGAYARKFIFYAEADRHVLNKKQFAFIALTPLFVVKVFTVLGTFLFFHHPLVYSWVFIMCAHSLFCAGDIGLLSIFYNYGENEIFTYDVKSEKKSYFFKQIRKE